jgi:hypothetical protein
MVAHQEGQDELVNWINGPYSVVAVFAVEFFPG